MIQIIEQTDEEKIAMYMKLDKEDLIKMLIHCNRIIESRGPIVVPYFQPIQPIQPFWEIPLYPGCHLTVTTS